MNHITDDTYKMTYRFNELVDLVNKKDGRLELTFEDQGYVDDIDLFLRGCIYHLPLVFFIDGSTVNKKLLSCPKKFKTMLDFNNGLIKCQGNFISDLQGYEKHNFKNKAITSFVISPGAKDYEELIRYFKMQ